jgi:hypothetical protein
MWPQLPELRLNRQPDDDNLAVERCRTLLGTDAHGLTDDEIKELRRSADAFAQILIDLFLSSGAPPSNG